MADGRRVFVLMPFEESLDSVYRTLIKGDYTDGLTKGCGLSVIGV